MRSPRVARAALGVLLLSTASIGLTAAVAPQTFYDDFPFLTHWIDLLPPYNKHLVTDVGGFYLGFAILFAWAAWKLQRDLVRATCVAWLVVATLHLFFHATHLDGFGTADAIAELTSLALLLVPPVVALWAARAEMREPAGAVSTTL